MYDIVFISFNECNADENYNLLKNRFPLAKRVHNITGIHNAHIAAAKKSFTNMFWVVDGDAQILDSFNFDYQVPNDQLDFVHVWRSKNPVNSLEYGYGGVKLLPKKLTINMSLDNIDMTTSISKNFKAMNEVSNVTLFNSDPFSAWRSGFRECVKLSSKSIERQDYLETANRLEIWCSAGRDKPYGEYAIAGALEGRNYGEKNAANQAALSLINDFSWLMTQFQQSQLLRERYQQ